LKEECIVIIIRSLVCIHIIAYFG